MRCWMLCGAPGQHVTALRVGPTLRLTDAGRRPAASRDVKSGVRWEVSECSSVLLVMVITAVIRWQPGAQRDDRWGLTCLQEHEIRVFGVGELTCAAWP
jgi:hypothetical protein